MEKISCPFVYSTGRPCAGHIVRVEAYKAELRWSLGADGAWSFDFEPRSHCHLFRSLKGNHAGTLRSDDRQMKHSWNQLPPPLQSLVGGTNVAPHGAAVADQGAGAPARS